MKIIDLLNKIANDEDVPEKIKYDDTEFKFIRGAYEDVEGNDLCYYDFSCSNFLNNEVEIIEDIRGKKIPEKINVKDYDKCIHNVTHKEKEFSLDIRELQIRYNNLLDYLKNKGDE